jgi:hypothetical protein
VPTFAYTPLSDTAIISCSSKIVEDTSSVIISRATTFGVAFVREDSETVCASRSITANVRMRKLLACNIPLYVVGTGVKGHALPPESAINHS